jgi:hypothetical protein
VSDEGYRRVVTEEQRERMYAARSRGGICAWCGKVLGADETVYLDRFLVGTRLLRGSNVAIHATEAQAPVGAECASSDLLERTDGTEPERCAMCGRGVYYRLSRATRHQAACSKRCATRAASARWQARSTGED